MAQFFISWLAGVKYFTVTSHDKLINMVPICGLVLESGNKIKENNIDKQ